MIRMIFLIQSIYSPRISIHFSRPLIFHFSLSQTLRFIESPGQLMICFTNLNLNNQITLKYFLSSTTNPHSSLETSSLKCSFRQSMDLLVMTEANLSVYSKCLPLIRLGSPPNWIATLPFFFLASLIFFLLNSIDSTVPSVNIFYPLFYS